MTQATVLIPTHAHPRLLPYAIASAQVQSVSDIEIFVVCDGADEVTVEHVRQIAAIDSRVRVFEHPKGERHGEAWRHEALKEARGAIVCYLSDDDLWLPEHVSQIRRLLEHCDFGCTYPLLIGVDNVPQRQLEGFLPTDREMKKRLRSGRNFIPLSMAGHHLTTYLRLPVGWAPGPADVYSDLFMWRKFVDADVRMAVDPDPTVCSFSSALRDRNGWTMDQRVLEIVGWWDTLQINTKLARRTLTDAVRSRP